MTRSGRHIEEKSREDTGFPNDNYYEGTSARTRPVSFDEIMLRRKNKKLSEGVMVGPVEATSLPMDNVVENDSNISDPGTRKCEPNDGTGKCVQEETLKVSSRKKRENILMREDGGDKGADREDNGVRRRDREDSTVKRTEREANTVKGKEGENRETVIKLKDNLKRGSVSKAKDVTDNQIQGGRRNGEHLSNVSEKVTEKRHSRYFADTDKYLDKNRGKSEREISKRRYRDEDDETNRDKITVKKHEPGRHHDYEISRRKEKLESSKSHYEELRLKRRRSRSRGHDKDRNRRSRSASPRKHSRTFDSRREHREATLHNHKARSGRQHSDADGGRISSNGSSSHYRRQGLPTSGLGGYSPRKRKSESSTRTPSPIHLSPEKKNVESDVPPKGPDSKLAGSVLPNLISSNHTVSSNVGEYISAVPGALSTAKPLAGVSTIDISTEKSFSDSLQLTHVTRPMRKLYIENVPASATEKAIMECLNNFLLSLDVNHIHGANPCTSCIIHKEKGQAVVEFLTPEDASAALSYNGKSFSGSILNIRCPKDFVDVAGRDILSTTMLLSIGFDNDKDLSLRLDLGSKFTLHVKLQRKANFEDTKFAQIYKQTGDLDKSVTAVDTINDSVQDSPYKIFVGGISKALSSEMVVEILSVFGPLKAYHFEVNNGQPCAFLEYKDQSVTLKACAGLSGMKLGGQVLTVVQSIPPASSLETIHKTPIYGVPAHAKPLLKQPTRVLKLNNMFSADTLSLLAESEVEEVLEDIRLECSRFGAIKSVNVIKQSSYSDKNAKSENSKDVDHEHGVNVEESPGNNKENSEAVNGECIDEEKHGDDQSVDDIHMAAEELGSQVSTTKDDTIQTELELENKLKFKGDLCSDEMLDCTVGSEATKHGEECILERGCVVVEFKRMEASCLAAHSLHGRSFGDQIVAVEYVDLHHYEASFLK